MVPVTLNLSHKYLLKPFFLVKNVHGGSNAQQVRIYFNLVGSYE